MIRFEVILVNVSEAAGMLDVSRKTIQRWVKAGHLVPVRGSRTLFFWDEIMARAVLGRQAPR